MSVDQGKLLELADDIENRGDKWAADKLRGLAQPAEAVLDRPARVAGRDFHPGQPVQQVIGRANAHYDATHDAAQGAVAVVIPNAVGVEIAWINPPSAGRPPVGTRLYTHPQAAPAQGDGKEWIAGYMQGANDYVGGTQGALDQDELRADAEMAQRHYDAELAASSSPEVRADPGIEVGGTQHGPAPSQEPVVVDAAMIERAKGPLPASFLIPASDWQRGFNDALKLIYEELPAALRAAINTKQK